MQVEHQINSNDFFVDYLESVGGQNLEVYVDGKIRSSIQLDDAATSYSIIEYDENEELVESDEMKIENISDAEGNPWQDTEPEDY